jgi:NTP pyrophosphatase (non-canonical NTP hydrolase)
VCLTTRELAELHEAIDKGRADEVGGELADVAIYVLSLAEMRGLDLGEEIEKKMAVNRGRRYERGPGGVHVRVS